MCIQIDMSGLMCMTFIYHQTGEVPGEGPLSARLLRAVPGQDRDHGQCQQDREGLL